MEVSYTSEVTIAGQNYVPPGESATFTCAEDPTYTDIVVDTGTEFLTVSCCLERGETVWTSKKWLNEK